MRLPDLGRLPPDPEPFELGGKIPWHEPAFSERMLAEHLTQEHDLASRRIAKVEEHVEFLASLLPDRPSRVLDLSCGPGLYCSRLAARGHECVGIDSSPASVRHAAADAARRGLPARYVLGDLRTAEFGTGFDLALFLYGEWNVFQRDEARRILERARAAVVEGGALVLEPQTAEAVQARGRAPATWDFRESGLFSPRPHLVLTRHAWWPAERVATTRNAVVDAETSDVEVHGETVCAYDEDELHALLAGAGFGDVELRASLTGREDPSSSDLMVVLAR